MVREEKEYKYLHLILLQYLKGHINLKKLKEQVGRIRVRVRLRSLVPARQRKGTLVLKRRLALDRGLAPARMRLR